MSTMPITAQTIRSSTLRQAIAQHPVRAFLLMVFGINWLLLVPGLLSTSGFGVLPFDLPLKPFILLASIGGLALPALYITRVSAGKASRPRLLWQALRWRVGVRWYITALCGMPLAIIGAASLWQGAAPVQALVAHWPQFFTALLPKALIIALLVSIWEELGWTGFLLPRLEARFGVLLAVLITNTFQALVHVPLLFIAGGLSDGGRIPIGEYPTYLMYLFVFSLGIRVVMTWLFNGSGGSLLIVALFHAMWNVTASEDFLTPFVPGGTGNLAYGTLAVCALLLVAVTRGRLAYHPHAAEAMVPRIDK